MLKPKAVAAAGATLPAPDVRLALDVQRLVITHVSPCVDGGRFPAKGIEGEPVNVEADIFIDGHEQLAACVRWGRLGGGAEHEEPMRFLGNDRWRASLLPAKPGGYWFVVEAWLDRWGTFRQEVEKKVAAGVPVVLELEEGRQLVREAQAHARGPLAEALLKLEADLRDAAPEHAARLVGATETLRLMAALDPRPFLSRNCELVVEVDRRRAGFASWYELFPRSQTQSADRPGTLDDVIARLPALREMGFDVLYMPPIHPIGATNRKGRNNSLRAEPGDPGSPYAIGSAEGGHDAVAAELGGLAAFRRLRDAVRAQDMEIALDFAIQCSPDHPWLKEHPEWFRWRADGSIRYAENPPKKYEDIVNVDFYAPGARPSLWIALRDVVEFWIDEGVRTFRVDNPHTKPLPFWEWLISDIRSRYPDVIFLAEAFTRPAPMYRLAQIGFSQSYTYFIWRNSKQELTEYLEELTTQPPKDFYRPHFFVNTPDINPLALQASGRGGFLIRAALAATLSGLWGMYSGFELCEAAALPGREEYLNSEKYEIRPRDWDAPGNIVSEITRLNAIRRAHPALHSHLGIRFHTAFNDSVLFYEKISADGSSRLLVAVSLDPYQPQSVRLEIPLEAFGLPDDGVLEVEELMRGDRFFWRGRYQDWWFSPQELPFAIWRARPVHGGVSRR